MMALDSQRTKPSSSMVGTRPFGLRLRYSGEFTTPKAAPASMRLYSIAISSQHQSTFCTLIELFLPQITSMSDSRSVRTWHGRLMLREQPLFALLVRSDQHRLRKDVSLHRLFQR